MSPPSTEERLDPLAALATLKTISSDVRPDLQFVAATREEGFEVASARATQALSEALGSIVRAYVDEYTESAPTPYTSAGEVSEGQVMWWPAARVPMLNVEGIDSDAADLPLLDLTPQLVRRLKLSAIRVPTATGLAVFYRTLSPSRAVGLAGKLAIFRDGDRFDVLPQRTVVLDRQVDAVVVNGIAFFDNRKRFQRVFGLLEELRQRAGQTFDEVTDGLRISNFEDMRAAATTQLQMLGKMASIAQKLTDYPAYKDAMTMPKLLAFIRSNPHTNVTISGEGDAASLVFESDAQHRFKILKLLDDDYLQSQLTELDYEANSKGLPLT
jgi:hypothetical protein